MQCRQGSDENSSRYRFAIPVHDGEFHVDGFKDPRERFKTSLAGTLTHHGRKASGTFSMSGPEPPNHTHCHGSQAWTATGVKLGDLAYPKQTFPAAANHGTLEAKSCPADHPVVAGGGVELPSAGSFLGESLPDFSSPDSWDGADANTSGSPATMRITAICTNDQLEHRTTTNNLPPDTKQSATVLCPAGTHVVGGGVGNNFAGTDPLVQVQSSRPIRLSRPGPR